MTPEEIEAATGGSPVGEPRRNGPSGSEVDTGRLLIWESKLSDGDEFLISLTAGADEAAAGLAMDRMAELEKPLADVGERGLVRRKSYRSGKTEVGVTALRRRYVLSLTHTATGERADVERLTDLLRTALTRL